MTPEYYEYLSMSRITHMQAFELLNRGDTLFRVTGDEVELVSLSHVTVNTELERSNG